MQLGYMGSHNYSVEDNTRVYRSRPHKKSCRSVAFSLDGEGK